MVEGRQGDSRHNDIVNRGIEVFGPSSDALVRELSRRLPIDRREALLELIEAWPTDAEGRPRDTDLLFARLVELMESLDPVPRSAQRQRRRRRRRRNRHLGGALGGAVGGLIGLPLGFVAYLVLRETTLPYEYRADDLTMWVVIMSVALPACGLGVAQGAMPTRFGHALVVGLVAFLLGALGSGTLVGFAAFVVAEPPGIPGDDEANLVRDMILGVVPLVAAACGALLGLAMGRRAWRRWTSWSELRAR